MGYECSYSGRIVIDPPIPADEVLAAGYPEPGVFGAKDVSVRVVEQPVEGVEGAFRRLVVAVEPCMSSYSAYQMREHLQEIVERWGDGRSFAGAIQGSNPHETGSIPWRFVVRGGEVVEERARVVWPGEEAS